MRSSVAVAARVWYSIAEHDVVLLQTRSDVAVGACTCHCCPAMHGEDTLAHVRSEVGDGARDSYCAPEHVVSGWHTRSVVVVGASASHSVKASQIVGSLHGPPAAFTVLTQKQAGTEHGTDSARSGHAVPSNAAWIVTTRRRDLCARPHGASHADHELHCVTSQCRGHGWVLHGRRSSSAGHALPVALGGTTTERDRATDASNRISAN